MTMNSSYTLLRVMLIGLNSWPAKTFSQNLDTYSTRNDM